MTTLRIPLHSFVDLITNSSSEIFVSATSSTVDVINKLIDSLLLAGGSRFKAADLFEVNLVDDPNEDAEMRQYCEREGRPEKRVIIIKIRIDSPAATEAAKILSNLTSTFRIDSWYTG